MIILLGASGYVGSEFEKQLHERSIPFRSVRRRDVDYYDSAALAGILSESSADFLINCAGYTGKPNVDACEQQKTECLMGNAILPGKVRSACEQAGIPWGHVSSGCIYSGSHPDGSGFTELDTPNFSFRTNNCSFYSGTKALGEELLIDAQSCFVWRLRIPFDHRNSPRNYLSKLMTYKRLLEARNSVSHLGEFVSACLDCWTKRVPFGIYNVTDTGSITTSEVTQWIKKLMPSYRDHTFDFFESEAEFQRIAAIASRSNCVMDNSKLRAAGIAISDVNEAIERSLSHWQV